MLWFCAVMLIETVTTVNVTWRDKESAIPSDKSMSYFVSRSSYTGSMKVRNEANLKGKVLMIHGEIKPTTTTSIR